MSFVVDHSVVSGWLLESQASAYSEAIAQRLHTVGAIAPPLLALEYTNVLRTACKRQKLIAAQPRKCSPCWPGCRSTSTPPLPVQP